MFHLGLGEIAGRLCSLATVILLGHRYGVVALGGYALALSLSQYLQPLIDFGLRQVGARLLAQHPEAASDIVARVQRRRLGMALVAVPTILLYTAYAKLPPEMKTFVLAFSVVGALYAFSLDWVAWGQGKLYLVGFARSVVPLSILAFLVIGRPPGQRVLWWAVAGNGFGFIAQTVLLRAWWRRQPPRLGQGAVLGIIRESLAWQRTSIMGLATFCWLAFSGIDLLMLGLMSSPEQVGLYGAAYRVLTQVLATYYVVTQVLYPRFARHRIEDRARMLQGRILLPLAGAGVLIAAVLSLGRQMVLTVEFGPQFLAACPLLLLLAWSIPLDFMTSYLCNAFTAWGMEKRILLCTVVGAASNIALNLAFIPVYGARGAALNTLLSYAIFLGALGWVGRTAKELAARSQAQVRVTAYS